MFNEKYLRIKIVITDVDGVLTDGGMYYSENGDELKKFNVRDGVGVAMLRYAGIPLSIVTGEKRDLIVNRAKKVGVEDVFCGVADKHECIENYITHLGVSWCEVAYIGDEINDFSLVGIVGLFFTVNDANRYIQDRADVVLPIRGGEGVIRYLAEDILINTGRYESIMQELCKSSHRPKL